MAAAPASTTSENFFASSTTAGSVSVPVVTVAGVAAGSGLIRSALLKSNHTTGLDTINFAIPTSDANHASGVWTIAPASGNPLPGLSSPVTIDGNRLATPGTGPQPGAAQQTQLGLAPVDPLKILRQYKWWLVASIAVGAIIGVRMSGNCTVVTSTPVP